MKYFLKSFIVYIRHRLLPGNSWANQLSQVQRKPELYDVIISSLPKWHFTFSNSDQLKHIMHENKRLGVWSSGLQSVIFSFLVFQLYKLQRTKYHATIIWLFHSPHIVRKKNYLLYIPQKKYLFKKRKKQ